MILLACALLAACTWQRPAPAAGESAPEFTVEVRAGIFTVRGVDGSEQEVGDVAHALQAQASHIRETLDMDYQLPVTVELFPDQSSLDRFGMNPEMQGYYAYSGEGRIQMVSPRNPLPRYDQGYSMRIGIALHEFVHLVNDAIDPGMPAWLDEGVAVYAAPHDLYDYACKHAFHFEQVPPFEQLEQSYNDVPAADLFAYTAVAYIAGEYSPQALNQLLRSPDKMEEILGISKTEFEQGWRAYLERECARE